MCKQLTLTAFLMMVCFIGLLTTCNQTPTKMDKSISIEKTIEFKNRFQFEIPLPVTRGDTITIPSDWVIVENDGFELVNGKLLVKATGRYHAEGVFHTDKKLWFVMFVKIDERQR